VKRRRALAPAALLLALLLSGNIVAAFAASNPIASAGHVGKRSQSVLASQLKPPECTGTVSSVIVKTGNNASYTGTNILVVGGSGNDNVNQTSGGYTCWVGGAGSDKFTGVVGAGDQCIVSNTSNLAQIKNCTVVARRP
jgi:hypothetical protein